MTSTFESLKDLANKYKMTESRLKTIIESNKIAHKKEGGVISVNLRVFDRWMAANIKNLASEKLKKIEKDEHDQFLCIHPLIEKTRVLINPPASTKIQIITRLVEQLAESKGTAQKNIKPILKAVIERERLCSTAIMDGVAIPHPRSSMEEYVKEPLLVVGISKKGVHFESDDGKPTNLFFLICANSIDIHLKVMARLSRLLRSPKFRYELTIAPDVDTVKEVFEKWEKKLK